MSDYTIENPKKKKQHYYKNRNKHRNGPKSPVENTEETVTAPASEIERQEESGAKKPLKKANNQAPAPKDNKEQKNQKGKENAPKANENKNSQKKGKKNQKETTQKEIPTVVEEVRPAVTPVVAEKKKTDNDFISYFSGISDNKHDYVPDKNAEGFSKDPPFTDFSTAYDPIADFLKEKETKKNEEPLEEPLEETKTVIGIRFRTSTKTYYFDPMGIEYVDDSFAIVETARGIEFGFVVMGNREIPVSQTFLPLRPALRPATKADKEHYAENRKKEEEAVGIWNTKVKEHGLEMKLIDVEYTFDNSKLLFYFTSEGRVDFRELVKDLASLFHCRIELRQMGIRDEAKVLGGLGVCGRAFCCGTFLPDFAQVSIKMAKEQSISLNSSKISGACGRLMCCLRFEHEAYIEAIQRTPSVDWRVKTPFGTGVVVETKPLAGLIKVKLDDNPDAAPTVCSIEDAIVLGRDKSKDKAPEEKSSEEAIIPEE